MKNKQIGLVVNNEDVRPLISQVLSLIISRENESRRIAIEALDEACRTGNTQDIMVAMARMLEIHQQTAQELQNMAPLVDSLGEKEELISPDAQVLKDLPDLEKDSFGVNSGGE